MPDLTSLLRGVSRTPETHVLNIATTEVLSFTKKYIKRPQSPVSSEDGHESSPPYFAQLARQLGKAGTRAPGDVGHAELTAGRARPPTRDPCRFQETFPFLGQ